MFCSADSGKAAKEILLKHCDLFLRKSSETGEPYVLKHLVKRIWNDFNNCHNSVSHDLKKPRGTARVGHLRLRGWEMMDIVQPSNRIRMRNEILDSDGCGWELLTEEVPVLVCRGLGEVIRPSNTAQLCPTWTPIPPKRKYLTASIICLQFLARDHGDDENYARLTDRAVWQPSSQDLFGACSHGYVFPLL